MTYKEILAQGPEKIAKLSLRELRAQVRILANTANRRIDRLQEANIETPATYDSFTGRRMERIRAHGKTLNELRSEFVRAAQFLNAGTSTLTGARKWRRSSISGLEDAGVTGINASNFKLLWHSFEKLKSLDSSVQNRGLKYRVLKEIQESIADGERDADTIAEQMQGELVRIYEEQEARTSASARDLDFWEEYEEEEE